MKKKILFIISLSIVMFICFGFITVNAAEPTTVAEEANEVITIDYQLSIFWEKFGITIIGGLSSVIGYVLVYLLTKKLNKRLQKKIEKGIDLNNEECQKATMTYDNAIKLVKDTQEQLNEQKQLLSNCIKENEMLRKNFASIKQLMAYLVASNENLSSNGYSQKILELLNEEGESNEEEGNN